MPLMPAGPLRALCCMKDARGLRRLSLAFGSSSGLKSIRQLSFLQVKCRFFILYYGDDQIAQQLKIKHRQCGEDENPDSVLGTNGIFPPVQRVWQHPALLDHPQLGAQPLLPTPIPSRTAPAPLPLTSKEHFRWVGNQTSVCSCS